MHRFGSPPAPPGLPTPRTCTRLAELKSRLPTLVHTQSNNVLRGCMHMHTCMRLCMRVCAWRPAAGACGADGAAGPSGTAGHWRTAGAGGWLGGWPPVRPARPRARMCLPACPCLPLGAAAASAAQLHSCAWPHACRHLPSHACRHLPRGTAVVDCAVCAVGVAVSCMWVAWVGDLLLLLLPGCNRVCVNLLFLQLHALSSAALQPCTPQPQPSPPGVCTPGPCATAAAAAVATGAAAPAAAAAAGAWCV